ncbi:MAG: hypothetical protein KIT02_00430 [Devosia sp.]|uniref:hypothetical protein n=1 Tax=Devosia sp. TaxID=1871048 RepID=UPI0024C56AFE|nr:hypothetical protein [Devosia sp.]UYN99748.1 MAG: hypothetical protein KIT02_00430 [Devosia sp.]
MKSAAGPILVLMTAGLATPALGADFSDYGDLRPSYEPGWETGDDSLRFEAGIRYWMSWGKQQAGFTAAMGGVTLGDVTLDVEDQSHMAEVHGRIDDLYTNTYLKGQAGLSLHTTGTYDISPAGSGTIGNQSRIGYAGVDYGWMPLGQLDNGPAAGGFVGYTYWKDAPDIGTGQIATAFDGFGNPTAFADAPDNLDIHALRIGARGTYETEMFDIQAEIAAVPYAHITGAVGGSAPNGFDFSPVVPVPIYENEQITLSGQGYGVMTEAMLGFHPTENLTLRVGGRAWYLEGQLDARFNGTAGGTDLPELNLPSNYASIFRYGALFELTGRF